MRINFLILLCLLIFLTLSPTSGQDDYDEEEEEWCYTDDGDCVGPKNWKGLCKSTIGTMQSPINIIPKNTTRAAKGRKLLFSKDYYLFNKFQLKNTGKTVRMELNPGGPKARLEVDGAGFRGRFEFTHAEFHWGKDANSGSEHTIKGKQYPLELQFHHKQVRGGNRLGIISIIFAMKFADNRQLKPIIDHLPNVYSQSDAAEPMEKSMNLSALFPNNWGVFRYLGSLTYPPCTEGVIWSVFTQRMPVSHAQMLIFRNVLDKDESPQVNFRKVQPTRTKRRREIYFMPVNKYATRAAAF